MNKNQISLLRAFNEEHMSFDEESHTYLVDGVKKESVSAFIKPLDNGEFDKMMQQAWFRKMIGKKAAYGTRVHKHTEDYDNGIDVVIPRTADKENAEEHKAFNDYIKWRKDTNWEPVAIELKMYSPTLDICGTIDRLFYDVTTDTYILLDLKTGNARDSHWHQQLVYEHMLTEWGIEVNNIILLSLKNGVTAHQFAECGEKKMKILASQVGELILKGGVNESQITSASKQETMKQS